MTNQHCFFLVKCIMIILKKKNSLYDFITPNRSLRTNKAAVSMVTSVHIKYTRIERDG